MRALVVIACVILCGVCGRPAGSSPDDPSDDRPRGRIALPAGARAEDVVAFSGLKRLPIAADGTFHYTPDKWLAREIVAKVWVGERFFRASARPKAGAETVLTLVEAVPPPHVRLRIVGPDGQAVPQGAYVAHDATDSELQGTFRDGVLVLESRNVEDRWSIALNDFRDAQGVPLPYQRVRPREFASTATTVVLELGRTVEGRIHLPDGRPVVDVWVTAWEDTDQAQWSRVDAISDADGRFRLEGLASELHKIEVGELFEMFVPPEVLTLAVGATSVDVVVHPKVAPRIAVQDPDGQPLPGVCVRLDALTDDVYAGGIQHGPPDRIDRLTNPDGILPLPLLSPRMPFRLRIVPPTDAHLAQDAWAWLPADTTVRLEREFVLRGHVSVSDGRDLDACTVWLRPAPGAPGLPETWSFERIEGGYVLGALVETDGSFRFRPLPEMTLEVFAAYVDADGKELRSAAVTVRPGGGPLELEIPAPAPR